MKIHVLLNKAEINPALLKNKVVIVLDILFATSSIVTALANGCRSIVPVRDVSQALKFKENTPDPSYLYSGELNADTLDGFIQPTPMALLNAKLQDQHLVYCTTNGTVALNDCIGADKIYVGSLLNTQAVVDKILLSHPHQTILIVCAGSNNRFNLEDFYGAGAFVSSFSQAHNSADRHFTDTAIAAQCVFDSGSALEILSNSRVGKMMIDRSWDHETAFVTHHNRYNIIPVMQKDGTIRTEP